MGHYLFEYPDIHLSRLTKLILRCAAPNIEWYYPYSTNIMVLCTNYQHKKGQSPVIFVEKLNPQTTKVQSTVI